MSRKVLITGIVDIRSALRSLPVLTALRQQGAIITLHTPHRLTDLFGRARLYDHLWVHEKTTRWHLWLKKRGFDDVYDMRHPHEDWPQQPPDVSKLSADVEFFTLQKPYILMTRIKDWPVLRQSGLARRLNLAGFEVVFLGVENDRQLAKAAPEMIDLSQRTTLPEVLGLALQAHAYIGMDDGLADLVLLSGATVVVLAGDDIQSLSVAEVLDRLPPRIKHG